ncbi:MAG: potassium-transporting ATPase subunit KdpA [Candidatus Melainabacteria bacterium]|nr:potassium-transporting ATPase subunit KdpA [Candidatus Melainabacteria bacterium]MBI3309345.1 potassium-transporting ATPase subunit KdpA [Candidatus Melainabacteria bacterium]
MFDILFIVLFVLAILISGVFFGEYMAKVFRGDKTFLSPLLRPLEKFIYKVSGINEDSEMDWKIYTLSFLSITIFSFISLFLLQEIQHFLPLNPERLGPVRWDIALNTTVSFVTNTNWQAYGGENTMSYLTQMLGLCVQNFISAGVGIAVLIAFIRGFTRNETHTIGNFWVDLTRSILYILLPFSIILAFIFISEGIVQTFKGYEVIKTLEGLTQTIPLGPTASQIAIKFLGTNGGGFFNANSAHPFENPTPFTNFLENYAMLLIPVALPFTFGILLNKRRQGYAIFCVMMILFLGGLALAIYSEFQGNPMLSKLGIHSGLNMEGKEVRFGIIPSILFAVTTTCTSCGGVNSMHDSLTPLSGLILLFNMCVGEVIFGGVGVGLIGLLVNAVLAMFIVGLMIGRSPEFLAKKLEPFEMLMAVISILSTPMSVLVFSCIAIMTSAGLASLNNLGPHGLSEILYAFASPTGNNGSAFGGLNASTLFYTLTTSLAMLIGRFTTIIPALAIAGALAKKKFVPPSSATFTTDVPLFVWLLVAVVILVGGLTYFPVLTLGPILEHLFMKMGMSF